MENYRKRPRPLQWKKRYFVIDILRCDGDFQVFASPLHRENESHVRQSGGIPGSGIDST